MDAVLSPIVERAFNFVFDPIIRQFVYIIHYRQNVDELFSNVENLGLEKETLDRRCDQAEKNVQNIEGKVKEWFRKVDEFDTEVEKFRNDEGHKKTGLPYLWNRHRLGRQAKKMTEGVKNLIDESAKFNEVAYTENVTNDFTFSNIGYVEFASRKSTVEKIMAKLEDSTERMIGLYGQGGMGKSTLIRAIAKKVKDKKLFNVVAISEITPNPNHQKIQEDIAYELGLRLEGEGENARARRLRTRLKSEQENTLIILDDLWDRLDLNKLGIPLDDDVDDNDLSKKTSNKEEEGKGKANNEKQNLKGVNDLRKKTSNDKQDSQGVKKGKSLGDYKGFKILLTSRDRNVLIDKMEVESTFCVGELDDKDVLMLFQKVARVSDEMSDSKQEIVKKYCAGLPMAIATVGRTLRDKSESMRDETFEKLKKQELMGAQNSMEFSVKMSYDHLENEELKSIFLVCAQMGHQPLIMDLVKYCFGLGILEGVYSLREARDKIYASIQKLKDSGLVLNGSSSIHFNMHDLVRDAALSIAHKKQNVFTLRNGRLNDWPELKKCTSISICNSDIIDELPDVINCPQLKFFQIHSDDPSLEIPESFFKGMKKLRVLILSGFHLSSLPSSIKCLTNLRLLCLEQCTLKDNLSFIGELKKLRILSFSGSRIEKLPAELHKLDKLQLLDISNCTIVGMILPNVISRLTCLEELYIGESLTEMLVEGEKNQSQISFLSELKHLHQLKVVDLSIPCAAVLPNDLFFDKLNDYKIVIGDSGMLSHGNFRIPNKYEAFRSLALQLKDETDNIHLQTGIKLLFKRVENLLLGELKVKGTKDVIYELNLDGFPDLKHLSIVKNTSIKYIIKSENLSYPDDVFPNLESLCLHKLMNIEMICCSLVTDTSFTKLKTIKVEKCNQLKNLFSFRMVKLLASLETIDVCKCGSLKEIVELPENSEKVEFLKLQSLTLQQLLSFTSFYTTAEGPSTNRDHVKITVDMAPLFGELVEMPKLESLNLSSINIHKIWSDQPLSSFCFQNLIKLVVEECENLRYLCSLSVASGLRKLKGLFVSKCQRMKKIFSTEGNSADKVCIFPNLEEIHLSEMDMLTDIWQAEVSADSFSSLTSVYIDSCSKLDKIFPSRMEGWFASLDSLNVSDCESVEVIFEIKDSQPIDASGGIDTNLQRIDLNDLPKLKQVWSRDPGGILNFKKLESIQVDSCDKLRNVFPASVAKDVSKLEYMSVQHCDGIVEIVACEDGSETNNEPLVFPELNYVSLCSLSNIRHFYKGRHPIECPKLKKLTVNMLRNKLKTFPTETRKTTNEEEKAVFSAEKVFPNLEYLDIHLDEAQKWLLSNIVKCRMHRLKELRLSYVESGEPLYQFLYRMPNLEKLHLYRADHLLRESSMPCLGTVIRLKELVLSNSDIKDLKFVQDSVLQRLELFSLQSCDDLINLALPSVSLTYLTYLEVNYCDGLKYLMASSTAKSLVQLKTMKVIRCKELKAIVTNEGNEEEKDQIKIVFSKLVTIELDTLYSLTSFCSYKNFKFEFPSLEILIVEKCPVMETFSSSPLSAPRLQNILAVEGEEEPKWQRDILAVEEEEEAKWQWEGDLNATIEKRFKNKDSEHARIVRFADLQRDPVLKQIWNCSVSIPDLCFSKLNHLTVDGCQFLSDAVLPFNLLPFFTKLKTLKVRNCDYVKTIFDVKCITKDRKEISDGSVPIPDKCFSKLHSLIVDGCQFLSDAVLPFNLLPFFPILETLQVRNCNSVKTIFDVKRITQYRIMTFTLKELTLSNLPKLENVWNEDPHGILRMQLLEEVEVENCKCLTSVFPASVAKDLVKLENLVVKDCEGLIEIVAEDNADPRGTNLEELTYPCPCVRSLKLEGLPKKFKYFYYCSPPSDMLKTFTDLEPHTEDQVCLEKPNLQCLSLGENGLEMIKHGEFQRNLLHKLQVLTLCPESDVFPYEILQLVPNIEKLGVCDGFLKEFFCRQSPNVDTTGHLSQLKVLRLEFQKLASIALDNSWTEPFLRNLDMLKVIRCFELKSLVPCTCTVSFSNLTFLEVRDCYSLLYLFTSSTARSLTRLKRMEIKECHSIKEIVSKKGDESNESEEIIFEQLQVLYLERLDKLRCFYPGNFTLRFPSLEQVYVIDCLCMKTFSPVNIIDHPTEWFSAAYDETPQRECDLNLAVRRRFEKELFESACSETNLNLRNEPLLQEIWNVSVPIPDKCSSTLQYLTVDGCQFLSDAVLPFHLLPLFTKLKTLKVRNCNSVKTIFDVKCLTQDRIMTQDLHFPLKKLTLERLPNLENVWNEDPHEILSMQLLQKVSVDNCKCLTSVFPASVAKDLENLKNLALKDCEGLTAIVAEDNAHPRGKNLELTFPCVTSLELHGLPNFKFNGTPFELTPNVEHLTLGENELKMILRGEFQGNHLHKLKVHTLCIRVESDVFLQQVHNVEKVEVCDDSFKEIFCLPELKVSRLESLGVHVSVGLENSWIEPFLKNLETLEVISSFTLEVNLVPSTLSFSNLTDLKVHRHRNKLYLFTSSTARSLARLKRMEIKRCDSIEEVVSKEGDESNESEEIIFEQLQVLYLEELQQLRCFYPGNFTLHFPCLKQVYVINCPWMKTFSPVNKINHSTEWFSAANDATPQQECDLNSAARRRFEEKLLKSARSQYRLHLADSPLQEIWQGSVPIPDLCFRYLYSLTVDGCQFLSDAVLPFNLLPFFPKLETLQVRNCNSVKTIFDVKCITQDTKMILPFPLKYLTLKQLPKLENVWNEDPHGILSMQLLQEVEVENCKCLTSVFPASVAKDLVKLENLVVKDCKELMEIVAEDNADPRGTNLELTFPCVKSLELHGLPKFKFNGTAFELTPNVEHLTLGENELKMILRGEFQGNHLHKLKVLTLCFHVESLVFAYGFLQQVHNIEKLEVCDGSFKEIFCLPELIVSHLESLGEFISIGLENSWIEPFLRNQETLKVINSFSSVNLVPSTVSFSNLTDLKVDSCSSMLYLFTSSTATSLAQLKTMKITGCDSIEEIVSKEGDESHENEIIFQQLNILNLEKLPKLTSFYRGSLSFPSLETLSVIDCDRMETLCPGTVKADKLFEVELESFSEAVPLEIDLNSTMRKAFLARAETALLQRKFDESDDEFDDESDEDE